MGVQAVVYRAIDSRERIASVLGPKFWHSCHSFRKQQNDFTHFISIYSPCEGELFLELARIYKPMNRGRSASACALDASSSTLRCFVDSPFYP